MEWVNRYLEDPSLYRAQRERIVREWVQFTDGRSGERLGDAILAQAGLGAAAWDGATAGAGDHEPDARQASGERAWR